MITIGLLSKFELQCKIPEGYTLDVRHVNANKGLALAMESVGDLKKGIEIGPNVILRYNIKRRFRTIAKISRSNRTTSL